MQTERITLRGLEESDIDKLSIYWNNQEFMNYSGRIREYTRRELLEWVHTSWKLRKLHQAHIFGITSNENKHLIGTCKIKILNNVSRRADLSIGIFNPAYRGRGLGTETMNLLIDYSFNTLNLLSLELKVFENNSRAITCYKKVGFRPIGVRRKADFINGEFVDDLMMDLLLEDWICGKITNK